MSEAKEPTVAREVAEADFERWLVAMRLTRKADPNLLNDEDKKSLAEAKGAMIAAIMDGNLSVNESGVFVFTPYNEYKGCAQVVFHKPKGSALMAMDKAKAGDVATKQFKFMADMTRTNVPLFANMEWEDLSICLYIANFFTAPG